MRFARAEGLACLSAVASTVFDQDLEFLIYLTAAFQHHLRLAAGEFAS